ncbi:hypothetical protein SK128_020014, partial [Halocaridina rubra]
GGLLNHDCHHPPRHHLVLSPAKTSPGVLSEISSLSSPRSRVEAFKDFLPQLPGEKATLAADLPSSAPIPTQADSANKYTAESMAS